MGIRLRNLEEQAIVLVKPGVQTAQIDADINYADFDGWIANIWGELSDPGGVGSQITDLNKNGVTVFGTDAVKITHGTDVTPVVFTGVGLNDATAGGDYTGVAPATFTVIIDATGTPDTFKWKKNNGSFTTGVAASAGAHTLSDGVTITFSATTGHTLADQWVITCPVATQATYGAIAKSAQYVRKGDRISIDVDSVHTNVGNGLSVHVLLTKGNPGGVGHVAPSALRP